MPTSNINLSRQKTGVLEDFKRLAPPGGTVVGVGPYYAKASEYIDPLRAKIEIWDLKKLERLYFYDSFGNTENNTVVTGADVELGIDSHGTFAVNIWDSQKLMNPKDIRKKNIVIISAKKYTGDPWINLIYGFTTGLTPIRSDTGMLEYVMQGVGSGSVINDRIINFAKIAAPESITTSNPFVRDPTLQANNLYKKLLTDSSVYITDDLTIADQLNIDVSLLDNSKVRDIVGGIVERYTPASNVYNAILEGVGAVGGVDANNRAFLRYPATRHSGITIKSWDYIDDSQNTDLARFTSYFMGPFEYELSWKKEDGFVNRWISKARTADIVSTSGTGTDQDKTVEIPLAQQNLAMQFTLNASNMRDFALQLRRAGLGTSDPTRIKTFDAIIRNDFNNQPIGSNVAYISYPLADIPESPTPIYITNVRFVQNVFPGFKYWFVTYFRGVNLDNTLFWTAIQDNKGLNAVRPDGVAALGKPWLGNIDNSSGWEVHTNSYSFMYSAFNSFTHAVFADDPESQDAYGLVEDSIDVQWAPSTQIINQFITERLLYSALPKVIYRANTVTIPTDLFLPGQIISIQDELSDLPGNKAITADVLSVHYPFGGNAQDGENLGCRFLDIQPLGSYDFRQEDDSDE